MKKYGLLILFLFLFFSCEIDYYQNCYTFEVRYEETYIPYRPTFYSISRYDRCGLDNYQAYVEAQSNEYLTTRYDSLLNLYVTQRQSCTYWRVR